MSTNDVPGFEPKNNDELAMGCWAEHEDKSLIFVKSTEGGRVVFEIYDVAKDPVVQYSTAMPEDAFKKQFSWGGKGKSKDKWTWHDKTPFPFDRVIEEGAEQGESFASAGGLETAAQRVRRSLQDRGIEIREREIDEDARADIKGNKMSRIARAITKGIKDALKELDE